MKRMLVVLAAIAFTPALARAEVVVSVPGIHVSVAPPAPRIEVRSRAPSAAHVWIAGHWEWRRGGHVWIPGRWALPPAAGYRWDAARWVHDPNGQWTFYDGHWVAAPATATAVYDPGPAPARVVVRTRPPAPLVEARPMAPMRGAVWIPGYWQWNGYRYVWVGGRWSAPRAGWHWQPHHWQRTGHGWVWVRGHWRRG